MLRFRLSSTLCLLVISLNAFWPHGAQADEYADVRNNINRGNTFLSRNMFQQAIEEYQKCLDIDPGNSYAKSNIVLAYNNWGIFYYQQGKYELAKQEWETALRISPSDRKARYNLTICQQALARQGKSQETENPPAPEVAEEKAKEPEKEKEKPAESAVVILHSGNNARDGEETPAVKLNSDAFVDSAPASKENAVAQQTHESKPVQPAASSSASLNSYYDSGIESGAKLMPRKHNDSEAMPKIDESINRLETKIYGQPRSETSVLKRLERMELDSFGKINDAPITERITKLNRLFSIDN